MTIRKQTPCGHNGTSTYRYALQDKTIHCETPQSNQGPGSLFDSAASQSDPCLGQRIWTLPHRDVGLSARVKILSLTQVTTMPQNPGEVVRKHHLGNCCNFLWLHLTHATRRSATNVPTKFQNCMTTLISFTVTTCSFQLCVVVVSLRDRNFENTTTESKEKTADLPACV